MQRQDDGIRDIHMVLDDPLSRDGSAWLLRAPRQLIVCNDPPEVPAGLALIEAGLQRGLWAAGFLAYELGYLFEPVLASLLPPRRDTPLLYMGLFDAPVRLDAGEVGSFLDAQIRGPHQVRAVRPVLDRETYRQRFRRVQALIDAGDVYQINLTFKLDFEFEGDPFDLYRALRRRQRVACGGLIASRELHVLSLSPELFLHLKGSHALVRPMKGTAPRGVTPAEDEEQRQRLRQDQKSQAENLMIVDLMRNDLGRLARTGCVRVTDLFTVETLSSLHQMTSGITADLRPDVRLPALLQAIFPCGSVTGAPKIRAMQIIRELEAGPRGVYTGSLALLAPDGTAALNVAIRTLVLHGPAPGRQRGELGIGSGLVHDSDADAEYDECLLKAAFLDCPDPPGLIETLRWDPNSGYALLDRHLRRLTDSAAYFGLPQPATAAAALAQAATSFEDQPMRVRLTLDVDGRIDVVAGPLTSLPAVLQYALSDRPVSSADPLRYHKTTRRAGYESELARLRAETGCDEVLFVNEHGELTEGCWTNLFVQRGDLLLTPPVACGLLDGTLRRELLDTRPEDVVESVLRPDDLDGTDAVLLGNSVRGLMPARRVRSSAIANTDARD